MANTIEVPISLLRKIARAGEAFSQLEDELEDYLLSRDDEFIARMRGARAAHLAGQTRPLADLKQELCIE
ncbi:MAG TPA: hypothetical protein VI789_09025 [Dehalococcoidia bacterium]|nr:hypothetical protein [Dehalococcoidia bacterium]